MTVIGLMFPESLKSSLCSRLQQNICTVRSVRFQRPVLSVRFSSCEFYHLSSQKQIFPLHPYVASLFTHIVKHKSDIIHWFLKIESMNRNSSSLGFLIIKTGCWEKKWSHYPWRCSRTVEMSHWVTWVSGHSGNGLIVRPHYPSGIFQPKCFYSSVILWKEIFWVSKLAWDCSNIVHLCTENGWITICRLFCSDPFLDPYHPQWGARKSERWLLSIFWHSQLQGRKPVVTLTLWIWEQCTFSSPAGAKCISRDVPLPPELLCIWQGAVSSSIRWNGEEQPPL